MKISTILAAGLLKQKVTYFTNDSDPHTSVAIQEGKIWVTSDLGLSPEEAEDLGAALFEAARMAREGKG